MALLLLLTTAGCDRIFERADAGEPKGTPAANVALGARYELSPKPSYDLCTDSADSVQLTDGESLGSDWRRPTTVGWARENVPILITIDLGRVEPIAEVRVHSIGGGAANVFLPNLVLVSVSDDGLRYHAAGADDSYDVEQNRADTVAARRPPHVFHIGPLKTRARFVQILLEPDGEFTFADEIEVIRGSHQPDQVVFIAEQGFTASDAVKLLHAARERAWALQTWGRLKDRPDDKSKSNRSSNGIVASPKNAADAVRLKIDAASVQDHAAWRNLRDEVYSARAKLFRADDPTPLRWTVASPMVQLGPHHWLEDRPSSKGADRRRLDIAMWQGETESAAISVANVTDGPLRIYATVTPLRGSDGNMLASDKTVTRRRAVFVGARGPGLIADALPLLSDSGLTLKPGQLAQVWLTFYGPDLSPGPYRFAVDLEAKNEETKAVAHELVQGTLTIHPIRLPSKTTLKSAAWAYIERADATKEHEAEAIADLRAHHVNADVLFWSTCLPMPKWTEAGGIEIDFTKHDQAIRRYHGNRQYLFFWGLGKKRLNVPGLPPPMTPEWRRAIREWVTTWVAHLKELGLDYDDYLMYPFDEMIPDEFYELAKFVKEEVDPKVRFFANSRGDKNGREMARIAPYIDVWCFRDFPYGAKFSPAEQRLRESGAEVWSYDCRSVAKGRPPYGYYRLQMWRAFARGDRGCGFWTYTDPGQGNGNAWDDFRGMDGMFGVVYGSEGKPDGLDLSGEAIVPSRRWEAWREGVEDYEYLVTLRDAISAARSAGKWDEADAARLVLDRVVKNVLENPLDESRIEPARSEITKTILELKRASEKR